MSRFEEDLVSRRFRDHVKRDFIGGVRYDDSLQLRVYVPKSGSLGCAVEVNSLIPQPLAVGYSNILSGKPDKASGRVLWEKTLQGPRVGPN
jgi:hypothetical protein